MTVATIDDLKAIRDPAERAREAQAYITRGEQAIREARTLRDSAIKKWRKTASQRVIAADLGLTPGLIAQIDTRKD